MCWCTPSIRTIQCNKPGCHPGAMNGSASSAISEQALFAERARHMSISRTQEILRDKGRKLPFEELLAEIYMTALRDAQVLNQVGIPIK